MKNNILVSLVGGQQFVKSLVYTAEWGIKLHLYPF